MAGSSEIVASFRLTPELWYAAGRLILQREHRWLSTRVTSPVTLGVLALLAFLDISGTLGEGLLPVLILLHLLGLLGCAALLLTPRFIRRKFAAAYARLPEENRQVIWRFSPFAVSVEGGMTRFEGGWDDLHEIIATPHMFLIFRRTKSASVIPASAFAGPEAVEDFVFMARTYAPKFVENPTGLSPDRPDL